MSMIDSIEELWIKKEKKRKELSIVKSWNPMIKVFILCLMFLHKKVIRNILFKNLGTWPLKHDSWIMQKKLLQCIILL